MKRTLKEIVEHNIYRKYTKYESDLDLSYCSKSVHEQGRGVGFNQCQRKGTEVIEGYKFCSAHAKEIKNKAGIYEDLKTAYVARFNASGESDLAEFDFSEKTDKFYTIVDVRNIVGHSLVFTGKQKIDSQWNRNYEFFEKESDAWIWLHEKSKESYENEKIILENILNQRNILEDLVNKEVWNSRKD